MEDNGLEFSKANFQRVPYNFVPINERVFIPKWGKDISQDIPFENGEDGTLTVKITNKTPLFVGGKTTSDEKEVYSAHIKTAKGENLYYIPSSTIKGTVRSVLEILSFAKMSRYDNDSFGYREFHNQLYKDNLEVVYCGQLCKDITKDGSESFYITQWKEIIDYNRKTFRFPLSGNASKLAVSEKVKTAFLSAHKASKYYEEVPATFCKNQYTIKDAINRGEPLNVFFTKSEDGDVNAIGMARYFRYPYKHGVSEGVKQDNTAACDLAECIFGYTGHTNKDLSLRGRVMFGNAFCKDNKVNKDDSITLSLWTPHASYYPYYVRQKGKKYTSYDDDNFEIAGRKRYRIHKELPDVNFVDNDNDKTLNMLAAGNEFECQIKLHNMKPEEIGALLSAITLRDQNAYHNMGKAKALGYGKVRMKVIKMEGLKKSQDEYIRSFEHCMNEFLGNNPKLLETEQFKMLISIASEHDAKMGFMSADGYAKGKLRANFTILEEKTKIMGQGENVNVFSPQNDSDYYKQKAAQEEEEKQKVAEEQERLKREKEEAIDAIQRKAAEEANAAREARIDAGLLAFLDEKFPNKDEYKVKDFKVAISKVSKWMKDKQETTLDNDEIQDLTTSLKRIYTSIKPKEKKDWDNSESKWWKELGKLIGNDEAEKMFNSIIG